MGYVGFPRFYLAVATVRGLAVHIGGFNDAVAHDTKQETWAADYWAGGGSPLPQHPRGVHMAEAVEFNGNLVVAGGTSGYSAGPTAHVDLLPLSGSCDIHEPDGTLAQANPVYARSDGNGMLTGVVVGLARTCASTDIDYFRISDRWGSGPAIVELTPPAGVDLQLALYDATGTTLLGRSANRGNVVESITLPETGTQFYVRVQSQGGSFSATQPYRLSLLPVQP
jgi:hypothetical protein